MKVVSQLTTAQSLTMGTPEETGASRPRMNGGGIYSSGDLAIISSTISGNYANAGAGIYLDSHGISPSELKAEITDSIISANSGANGGGGIYNQRGYLVLTGSEITGNGADYYGTGGGGIANMNTGVIEMVSGTISGNSAFDGSGVKNYGTFTMKGGSISHNKAFNTPAGIWATSSGGGVHNSGTFNLEGGSISGNYAYRGGGVSNSGTFNLKGGSISSNIYHASDGAQWVPYDGGGVYNYGTLNLEGGSISGNKAYNNGGGVYNYGGNLFIGGTSQIVNNQATNYYGGGIYTNDDSVTFDGTGVAIKNNKAKLPSPSQLSWYQGWGVYLESGIPITKNGFNPATQVTGNTRILDLPIWTEV